MKRILCMVCIFAMVISLCNVAVFASTVDTENKIITITTGADFKTYITNSNYKASGYTFIIEGTDPLPDGSSGIDLTTVSYSSPTGFIGTIKGGNTGNNILLSTALIDTIGAGDAAFENLILKSSGTITPSLAGNGRAALVGSSAQADASGDKIISFKDITNYVSVNCSTNSKYVGGIIGYLQNRGATFENCVNYGDLTNESGNDNHTGGILGYASAYANAGVTFTSCYNKGSIISTGHAGGICGNCLNASTTITLCGNYGALECNATSNTRAIGGIAGNIGGGTIEKSFNAGSVKGTHRAAGIIGHGAAAGTFTNCYNVGTITSTSTVYNSGTGKESASYLAYGISGAYNYPVTNCYNAGVITCPAATVQIADPSSYANDSKCTNNYYIGTAHEDDMIGTAITKADLAKLPAPFNADPWEKNENGTFYSLPQIKGNTFYAEEDDGWYIVATQPSAEFNNTQSFSTEDVNDAEYDQYGNYSVVLTKVNLTGIEDEDITEFGMYLLDANDNLLGTAVGLAGKRVGGVFGILFYGNKFEDGVTYKAQPYIKAGTAEYTGTSVEFQIADAE